MQNEETKVGTRRSLQGTESAQRIPWELSVKASVPHEAAGFRSRALAVNSLGGFVLQGIIKVEAAFRHGGRIVFHIGAYTAGFIGFTLVSTRKLFLPLFLPLLLFLPLTECGT